MKQIKVVHIANLDVGLKVHLGNYLKYQLAQGYHVSAVTHPGRWLNKDTTLSDGIHVKIVHFKPRISPLDDFKSLMQLASYFREEKFDIVHTHTVKPGLLGRLAARLVGIPIIVHTVHGFFFYDGMSSSSYRFFVTIEKLGALCSDLLLSQNMQDVHTAIREGICPIDKIHYLGNGIDLNRFDPSRVSPEKLTSLRSTLGILPQQPVIGFVARLVREKGIHEFLEAASIIKSQGVRAKFLVIGSDQPEKKTSVSPKEIINKYSIADDLILLGYRDDIPELICLMDIITLPSHGREGIPRILMEGAALAKPVVATRVRGIVESVEDGLTGVLVPVRNGPALAQGILKLVRNRELATEMGRQARLRAITRFDERQFFFKTDIEYRQLLKAKLGLSKIITLKPIPSK